MFDSPVPSVAPPEVAGLQADGWTLLDVRTDGEYADARVAGAVHIPMDQLTGRLDEIGDRVVAMCAVGGRSARVTEYLNSHGYSAVNLDGGIQAWADAGLPVETGP